MVVAAAVATFVVSVLHPVLVSSLPRSAEGEAVLLPWTVCSAHCLLMTVLFPWCLSLLLVKTWRGRVSFLVLLVALALLWQVGLGFDELLWKAWRRGL